MPTKSFDCSPDKVISTRRSSLLLMWSWKAVCRYVPKRHHCSMLNIVCLKKRERNIASSTDHTCLYTIKCIFRHRTRDIIMMSYHIYTYIFGIYLAYTYTLSKQTCWWWPNCSDHETYLTGCCFKDIFSQLSERGFFQCPCQYSQQSPGWLPRLSLTWLGEFLQEEEPEHVT